MTDELPEPNSGHLRTYPLTDIVVRRPWLTATVFTLLLTLVLLAMVPRPLSPDISGQLWIADRLRHGARLYIDISEINPPLWFWLAVPIDIVGDLLGVRAENVLILAMGFAAILSLFATDRLLGRYPPATRTALLLYAACILLLMPFHDLGQREQMTLMAALPYVALIAARREGQPVPFWLALTVGAGAAIGFAFKHYFVFVPLLLELWLLLALRRNYRPIRIETIALAVGAIIYVLAILIVTPGFLQVSVPELMLAYGATGGPGLRYLIGPAQIVWLLVVFGLVAQRAINGRSLAPISTALLIAATGFAMAWAIQHKGWPYQSIAVTGMLAIAMATTLAREAYQAPNRTSLLAVIALIVPILLGAVPTQWKQTPDTDIAPALADLGPGDTVAIVSKEGRPAWPSTTNRGFRFSGRQSIWILAAIDENALGAKDPRINALGRRVIRETVVSYRCLPPKRLVFMPRSSNDVTTASGNPLAFFRSDPQFASLLEHYRRLDRRGNFDTFELVRPLEPLPVDQCPRGL